MAARCTTPPVAMHHSSGNDAPSSAVRLHCWGGVRNQTDDNEFLDALDYSDFYDGYGSGTYMPNYGNDCSAFVAICWGLPYQGNSRYNTTKFRQNYSSIGDYADLQPGDALLTNGHMFLVSQNWETPPSGSSYDEPYVVCYEQTPPQAILSFWTYDQLSSDDYIPISNF